jgi:hypothetical protein
MPEHIEVLSKERVDALASVLRAQREGGLSAKRCESCNEMRPAHTFGKSRHASDGLGRFCSSCRWRYKGRR